MSPAAQTDAASVGHSPHTASESSEIDEVFCVVGRGIHHVIPSNIDQCQQPNTSSALDRLHTSFERFARLESDRIALDFRLDLNSQGSSSNTAWTFGELDLKATSLAAHLLKRPDLLAARIVPICMDRCPELYVAILAILKAGCAWCPIDPSFPTRRRQSLIARTGASIVVTAHQDLDGLPDNVVSVDITQVEMDGVPQHECTPPSSDDMAYLIWTSGTTGEPKGVPIHHGAVVASMKSLRRCIPSDVKQGNVRCLQFSQFTFDVFVQDLFYTWEVGGTLISSDRATMLGNFAELATRTKATHAHLTPAFAASVSRDTCPTLEVVTMIGEKLTQNVANDWGRNLRAFNTYGPAETTVVSTLRQFCGADDPIPSSNVGLPMPSVTAVVMRDGSPVVRGESGEMALGGPQLSHGYWKDPTKTLEKFVWNPHMSMTLYMTGDVVRMLEDGSIDFIGRTDDLIKVQGIRIELSEIAFSLRACHPMIQQVEVQYLNRSDRPANVIVAFLAAPHLGAPDNVLLVSGEAASVAKAAMAQARERLPDYMIPQVFLVVESIPRTSSAKIDRSALKAHYESADLVGWERQLAPSKVEDLVRDEWSEEELLILESIVHISGTSLIAVGRDSTLASIGIDSIAATRLAPTLNAKGFNISIAAILQCETLQDLLVDKTHGPERTDVDHFDANDFDQTWRPVVAREIITELAFVAPALPLQEALLTESLQRVDTYWSNNVYTLEPNVDLKRLQRAWEQVAIMTDALRIIFFPTARLSNNSDIASTFLQLIHEEHHLDWKNINSSEALFQEDSRSRADTIARRCQSDQFMVSPWAVTVYALESRCVMVLTIHHSIRDDISLSYLLADLKTAYIDPGLLQPRHQLKDILGLLLPTSDQRKRDEEYWTKRLTNFLATEQSKSWPQLLNGSDEPRGSSAISRTKMQFSYEDLKTSAISVGTSSVASLLRFAWGCILCQYLETDRIVFGETLSDRNDDPSLGEVIGPLIGVLPVPFRLEGTAVTALREQIGQRAEDISHAKVHPRTARSILGVEDGQPLYPAMYNFRTASTSHLDDQKPALWRSTENNAGLAVEHPIALNVSISTNDEVLLELNASHGIADRAHLQVLAQQVEALVEAVIRNKEDSVSELCARPPSSLVSITPMDSCAVTNEAREQSPTHWVDFHAKHHPEWPAAQVASIIREDELASDCWSYGQLHDAYTAVTARILTANVTGRNIAVCLSRQLDVYAILLAIMKTGNTYLPIAEDLPQQRRAFMLRDSNAAIIFTSETISADLYNIPPDCKHILVNDSLYQVKREHEQVAMPRPSDNAYLLYTSGSTGAPKGVLVSRGNLTSFIEAASKFMHQHVDGMHDLCGKGRYLGFASFAFDVHLKEIFAAWRHGMAVVTAPRTMLLDDLELALRKLKITHASFVPSLVDSIGLEPDMVPDLRYMSVGGEMLSRRIIDKWAGHERVTVVNAYGPTEATIGCCFAKVTKVMNVRNIGPPLAFTTAHVLKPGTTEHVMRGVAGELCLTGDLIANGYLNRPDAKGFVEDFRGERMYRTGDRVRLMADGTLEFLGRDDDQTKIRGQRLELGEVSEAVRAAARHIPPSGNVDAAAMLALNPLLGRKQLVAFVTVPIHRSSSDNSTSIVRDLDLDGWIEEIRAACQKSLPSFMVPDHTILLTNLPLVLSSRKIDMKLLSGLFSDYVKEDSRPLSGTNELSPRSLNKTESNILAIARSVLHSMTDEIPPMTSLFRQGLDSLSAISLAVKLQKAGYQCTVSDIFKNASIEKLACLSHDQSPEDSPLAAALPGFEGLELRFLQHGLRDIDRSMIVKIRPCLPLQETMIASSLDQRGETPYVNHVAFQISSEVDVAKLCRAWEDTVADLEILRTCFQEFDSHFVQIVLRHAPIDWKRITGSPRRTFPSRTSGHQSDVQTDLLNDLSRKPPIRFTIVESEDGQKTKLLISIHHALYDEESFHLMLGSAHARYEARPSSQTYTSHDSFLAYVASQNESEARQFWQGYLKEYKQPVARDPVQQASPSVIEMERKIVDRMPDLEDFASSANLTPAAVLQSVFGIVLAQHERKNDIVFGAISSGRTVPIEDPHSIIAPCVVTIPQRLTIYRAQSSATDVMRSATDGFFQSIQYQHTALREIHRWIGAERPLFDCLFSYRQKQKPPPWAHLWWEVDSSMTTGFPFAVEVEADREAGHVLARATANAGFGDRGEVESFLESMQMLLQALMSREPVNLDELGFADSGDDDEAGSLSEDVWSDAELRIRDIASDMTGVERRAISKGASFFRLGIDSISAIRFARNLRATGFECSSADVMRCASIAKLSSYIRCHQNRADTKAEAPVGATDFQQADSRVGDTIKNESIAYPCTPLQSSMLMQTLGSDGRLYSNHHVFHLAPEVNITRLRKAWEQLVMQTEILRTTFHLSDDGNVWLAKVRNDFSLPWHDWTGQLEVPAALTRFKADFCFQEISDYATPPWKLHVIGESLVVSMHHSLYDGQSLNVMFADLSKLYDGNQMPIRTVFGRAAQVVAASNDNSVSYWTRSIEDYVGTRIIPTGDIMQRRHRVMAVETSLVTESCRSIGVTLQSVALLAFAKSLADILGHRDMVIGHVVGGRSVPFADADEIIGPLFNTVPLRITLNKAYVSNGAAAREIQRLTGRAQSHQHASLGKIQQLWQSKRGDSEIELLNSIFVFQPQSDVQASPLWKPIDLGDEEVAPTEYATNFEVEQGADGISVQIASTQIKDLDAWLDIFESALRDILEQPHRPVLASPPGLRSLPLRPALSVATDVSENTLTPGHDLTCLEDALAEVTQLERGRILPNASIYSLGLDSLSAIKVATSCRKRGLHVTVAHILQGKSLHGIVRRLRQRKNEDPAVITNHNSSAPPAASQNGDISSEVRSIALDLLNLQPKDVERIQPCLPGQIFHLAGWFKSGRTMGEGTFVYKAAERLDPDKLRRAWHNLRRRHPILRTTFASLSSSCVQVVLHDATLDQNFFRYNDLAGACSDDLNRHLQKHVSNHFDMLTPPCGFHLIRTDTQDFIALKLHHALYDAYTITTLIHDLIAIYKEAEPASTPTKEHICHASKPLAPDSRFKPFWSSSLQDCQPTFLHPKTHPQNPQNPPFFFSKTRIPNLHSLSTLAQTHHITLNTLILSSFARALAAHTAIPSPVFGFYQAGRSTLPTPSAPSSTPYLNVLPLMIPNILGTGLPPSARALQDHLAQRVEYEQSHLMDVLAAIGHPRDLPLFNAYINILGSSSPSSSEGEFLTPYHLPTDIDITVPTTQRYQGPKTVVDGLETGFLAEENVFLDVVADVAGDRLELVLRCDTGAMAREEAEVFLKGMVGGMEGFG